MSGHNNQPAPNEQSEHRSNLPNRHPTPAATTRHAPTVARIRRAIADIAHEVALLDQAIARALWDPDHDVMRRAVGRIALALRLLERDLGRLLARFGVVVEVRMSAAEVAAYAAARVGGGVVGIAAAGGPVSSSSSGVGVLGSGVCSGFPAAVGIRGLASSGVAGSSGAGSADGDSISDDSTAVASSDNGGPVDDGPMARGSPSATVGPINIPRVGNQSNMCHG